MWTIHREAADAAGLGTCLAHSEQSLPDGALSGAEQAEEADNLSRRRDSDDSLTVGRDCQLQQLHK